MISYDTTDFHIEGKEGSWLAYDSIIIDGREFFLMEHTVYGAQAANVVLDADGKLAVDNVCNGFDETVKQQIREYLNLQKEEKAEAKREKPILENWQKAYENGEYLRSAEITEEQNYNMIDGRMNNLPTKPRKIGERISVLDRLHLKQAEIARRGGKSVPQMAVEEDMERKRKWKKIGRYCAFYRRYLPIFLRNRITGNVFPVLRESHTFQQLILCNMYQFLVYLRYLKAQFSFKLFKIFCG